jgi:hypothetical protein
MPRPFPHEDSVHVFFIPAFQLLLRGSILVVITLIFVVRSKHRTTVVHSCCGIILFAYAFCVAVVEHVGGRNLTGNEMCRVVCVVMIMGIPSFPLPTS